MKDETQGFSVAQRNITTKKEIDGKEKAELERKNRAYALIKATVFSPETEI